MRRNEVNIGAEDEARNGQHLKLYEGDENGDEEEDDDDNEAVQYYHKLIFSCPQSYGKKWLVIDHPCSTDTVDSLIGKSIKCPNILTFSSFNKSSSMNKMPNTNCDMNYDKSTFGNKDKGLGLSFNLDPMEVDESDGEGESLISPEAKIDLTQDKEFEKYCDYSINILKNFPITLELGNYKSRELNIETSGREDLEESSSNSSASSCDSSPPSFIPPPRTPSPLPSPAIDEEEERANEKNGELEDEGNAGIKDKKGKKKTKTDDHCPSNPFPYEPWPESDELEFITTVNMNIGQSGENNESSKKYTNICPEEDWDNWSPAKKMARTGNHEKIAIYNDMSCGFIKSSTGYPSYYARFLATLFSWNPEWADRATIDFDLKSINLPGPFMWLAYLVGKATPKTSYASHDEFKLIQIPLLLRSLLELVTNKLREYVGHQAEKRTLALITTMDFKMMFRRDRPFLSEIVIQEIRRSGEKPRQQVGDILVIFIRFIDKKRLRKIRKFRVTENDTPTSYYYRALGVVTQINVLPRSKFPATCNGLMVPEGAVTDEYYVIIKKGVAKRLSMSKLINFKSILNIGPYLTTAKSIYDLNKTNYNSEFLFPNSGKRKDENVKYSVVINPKLIQSKSEREPLEFVIDHIMSHGNKISCVTSNNREDRVRLMDNLIKVIETNSEMDPIKLLLIVRSTEEVKEWIKYLNTIGMAFYSLRQESGGRLLKRLKKRLDDKEFMDKVKKAHNLSDEIISNTKQILSNKDESERGQRFSSQSPSSSYSTGKLLIGPTSTPMGWQVIGQISQILIDELINRSHICLGTMEEMHFCTEFWAALKRNSINFNCCILEEANGWSEADLCPLTNSRIDKFLMISSPNRSRHIGSGERSLVERFVELGANFSF